jgi:hypothetical protein
MWKSEPPAFESIERSGVALECGLESALKSVPRFSTGDSLEIVVEVEGLVGVVTAWGLKRWINPPVLSVNPG